MSFNSFSKCVCILDDLNNVLRKNNIKERKRERERWREREREKGRNQEQIFFFFLTHALIGLINLKSFWALVIPLTFFLK